jgi:2-oxoglutarate ferredoxin oxidoreductase subunit gamma
MDRFLSRVKPGGTLIYDTYGISTPPKRDDINIFEVNAMDTAAEMKNMRVFNMLILGGLLKINPFVKLENVEKALYKTLPARHHDSIPDNMEALRKGMEIIKEV